MSATGIKESVRRRYSEAALRVQGQGSCCGGSRSSPAGGCDPITSNLYSAEQRGEIPGRGRASM